MHGTAIGVDVGGSGIRAALVDAGGRRDGRVEVALHGSEDQPAFAAKLRAVVERLAAPADAPVGVSVPGFPDADDIVRHAINVPGLDGARPADLLGRPTSVVPDLAAAVLAESVAGCGRGVDRLLMVALGTGANAAFVAGGRIVETAYGCLGDAGHVIVEPGGAACPSGCRGCLEAVASASALARAGSALGFGDAAQVVEAARSGHDAAGALVRRAGVALGRALASWSVMTFPDRIAVGGGLAGAGALLLEPAVAELRRAGASYVVGRIDVRLAELGQDAALAGAGLAALAVLPARGAQAVGS